MKKSLAQWQTEFFKDLFQAEGAPTVHSWKNPAGFEIYRGAFLERLKEAVQDDFPVSWKLLTPAITSKKWKDFSAIPRSRTPNLNGFGAAWLEFLLQDALLPEWLKELIIFEWSMVLAFHAEFPHKEKAWTVLSEDPAISIQVHPSIYLFSFQYPVDQIFQEEKPIAASPTRLAVFSQDGFVDWTSLSMPEYRLLSFLQEGRTWSDIEEDFSRTHGETAHEQMGLVMQSLSAQSLIRMRTLSA